MTVDLPWYRKLLRPIPMGRSYHIFPALWMWYGIMEIAAYRHPKPIWLYYGAWCVVLVWMPLWVITARGRLIDLRVSALWILPIAAVWCFAIRAFSVNNWSLILPISGLVIACELPLFVIPSRRGDPDAADSEVSHP